MGARRADFRTITPFRGYASDQHFLRYWNTNAGSAHNEDQNASARAMHEVIDDVDPYVLEDEEDLEFDPWVAPVRRTRRQVVSEWGGSFLPDIDRSDGYLGRSEP